MTPPVTNDHHYGGPERREEPDLRVLMERMDHLREGQDEIKARLAALEQATREGCRQCTAWPRITELEKQSERMKGIAVGVSTLIGALWALASFLISHYSKGTH